MSKNTLLVALTLLALIGLVYLDMSQSGMSGGEYYVDLFSVGGWMP